MQKKAKEKKSHRNRIYSSQAHVQQNVWHRGLRYRFVHKLVAISYQNLMKSFQKNLESAQRKIVFFLNGIRTFKKCHIESTATYTKKYIHNW